MTVRAKTPRLRYTLTQDSIPSSWVNSDVSIMLVGLGSVDRTFYAINGMESEYFDGPVVIDREGRTSFEYWSENALVEEMPHNQQDVLIDKTKPVVGVTGATVQSLSASLNVTASDPRPAGVNERSGLEKVVVLVDSKPFADLGSAEGPRTVSLSALSEGEHSVEVVATDKATNTGRSTFVVLVDKTAPTSAGSVAGGSGAATVNISAADKGPAGAKTSGVKSLSYRLNSAAAQTIVGATAAIPVRTPGSFSVEYWATDAAGNVEARKTVRFVVTKTKVSLGTPVAPKTMKRSKSYTVYGSLKPEHAAGSKPVRIYKYKQVGKKWVKKGYVTAKAYDYKGNTRYKVKMKLTSKGKWRLRAYAPSDAQHVATWSAKYDSVTVK